MKTSLYSYIPSMGLKTIDSAEIASCFCDHAELPLMTSYMTCEIEIHRLVYIIKFIQVYYLSMLDYTNDDILECLKSIDNSIQEILTNPGEQS